jgi:hypothetical protein
MESLFEMQCPEAVDGRLLNENQGDDEDGGQRAE